MEEGEGEVRLARRLLLLGVGGLLVWGAVLVALIPVSYYCFQGGHRATISLDHYRRILANLSLATNVSKLYIRHDVDTSPKRLYPVLAVEAELGFNSTVCIYPVVNRGSRVLAGVWQYRSRLSFDWDVLQFYCMAGWVVSYHLNAYERAGYDPGKGDALALRDVRWIEGNLGFEVDRFSPHGGFGGDDGSHNCNFSGRFAELSYLWLDEPTDYDYYFSDSNGVAFSVPREISGSVYLLVHPEWYG